MPDIVLSIKGLSETIEAGTKAFDELYSLLKKMALDGWNVGALSYETILTNKQATSVRSLILSLRELQISKLVAARTISVFIDAESIDHWQRMEEDLGEVLVCVEKTIADLRGHKLGNLTISMRSAYPELMDALYLRRASVSFGESLEYPGNRKTLEDLAALLEKEAAAVGKCADLITDYLGDLLSGAAKLR